MQKDIRILPAVKLDPFPPLPYYYGMANRKTGKRSLGRAKRVPVATAFWVLFFIVLITSFFILVAAIKINSRDFFADRKIFREKIAEPTEAPAELPESGKPPVSAQRPQPATPTAAPTAPPAPQITEKPEEKPPAPVQNPPRQQSSPQETASVNVIETRPPEDKPAETRESGVYFMQTNRSGAIQQLTKVSRRLKVSDSPLFDSLNTLFAGPTAEEKTRDLASFIPPASRIISVRVQGNTAYININDEFQFNTFGREGADAQLRQIVWTATEFPNIHNVQILIEGEIVETLSEGTVIGSPLARY